MLHSASRIIILMKAALTTSIKLLTALDPPARLPLGPQLVVSLPPLAVGFSSRPKERPDALVLTLISSFLSGVSIRSVLVISFRKLSTAAPATAAVRITRFPDLTLPAHRSLL